MCPLDKLNTHRTKWKSAFYRLAYGSVEDSIAWLFANEHFRRAVDTNLIELKRIEENK